MPLQYKLILSAIVLMVGGAVVWSEFANGETYLGWVAIAIMAIMVLGQWVFPEAGAGKSKK